MGCKCVSQEQIGKDVNMDYLSQDNKIDNCKTPSLTENNNNMLGSKNSSYRAKNESYTKNANYDTSTKFNSNQPIKRAYSFYSSASNNYIKSKVVYEVNYARIHPQRLIPKIKNIIPKIKESSNKLYINLDNNINIKLNLGEKAFENCLSFLSTQKKLPKLIYKEELDLAFPKDPTLCDKENYLTQEIKKKLDDIQKYGLQIINFHYDIFYLNPELSVLMQIIDDTNSKFQRRYNIYNPDAKYLGVNVGKIKEGVFCFYLVFAKDLK